MSDHVQRVKHLPNCGKPHNKDVRPRNFQKNSPGRVMWCVMLFRTRPHMEASRAAKGSKSHSWNRTRKRGAVSRGLDTAEPHLCSMTENHLDVNWKLLKFVPSDCWIGILILFFPPQAVFVAWSAPSSMLALSAHGLWVRGDDDLTVENKPTSFPRVELFANCPLFISSVFLSSCTGVICNA